MIDQAVMMGDLTIVNEAVLVDKKARVLRDDKKIIAM